MGRKLAQHVEVGGVWYGPDDDVPDDVAAKITNKSVWADGDSDNGDGGEDGGGKSGTGSGARLARTVEVDGTLYGPDDYVPDNVAKKITNPSAWEGRRLPREAEAGSGQSGQRSPATPARLPGSGPQATRAGDQTGRDDDGDEPDKAGDNPDTGSDSDDDGDKQPGGDDGGDDGNVHPLAGARTAAKKTAGRRTGSAGSGT